MERSRPTQMPHQSERDNAGERQGQRDSMGQSRGTGQLQCPPAPSFPPPQTVWAIHIPHNAVIIIHDPSSVRIQTHQNASYQFMQPCSYSSATPQTQAQAMQQSYVHLLTEQPVCVESSPLTSSSSSWGGQFAQSLHPSTPFTPSTLFLPDAFASSQTQQPEQVSHQQHTTEKINHQLEQSRNPDLIRTPDSKSEPKSKPRSKSLSNQKETSSLPEPKKKRFKKPRSLNGFMLFSSENRRHALTANGFQTTIELAIQLGRMWRELPDEVRAEYKERAKEFNESRTQSQADSCREPDPRA